ncbi:MAG TPA: M23 family metallopeptidase [Chloroflexi bacterium]|nr:M23 family metallopeptidase [Chloroflexota bacterium]
MSHTNSTTGGGKSPLSLSLLAWSLLAAILVAAAYLVGAGLAQRWITPPPALSSADPTPILTPTPTSTTVNWLTPGEPADGTLGTASVDEWRFQGHAGQSVTIEMWLHPGSGSSVEAELTTYLVTTGGATLVEEGGSVFLPPYLSISSLPADDLYYVRVLPASGAPGRYSLLLTLSEPAQPGTPGAPQPQPRRTPTPSGPVVSITPGQFQWPTTRRRISGWTFHDPGNPGHIGLDIAAEMWDPIVAAAGGVVAFAEWGGGYGNLVIVEHPGGWRTYYAHFSKIVVKVGQEVMQGELLGGAGTTGYSTGPHLHFEIRYQGRPVDPQLYLP